MKYHIIILLCLITLYSCLKKTNKDATPSAPDVPEIPGKPSDIHFSEFLGINAFEWDFVESSSPGIINESMFEPIKSFSTIRHYLDWEKIEPNEGKFTFNPSHSGSWDYDLIYQRIQDAGMEVIIDIKTCPPWLLNTYPSDERDVENVPAPYGLNRSDPISYIKQAKAAFQLAARYGRNKNIDPSLMVVDKTIRWTGDVSNVIKIGLGTVKYIECDNERDKWWKGKKAQQSPEEYAANMSAFYDGDKGKLGKNVGVKTADPNMMVVLGGLANPDPDFVIKMIEWCRKNRGTKPDGSVDLCFDIINYHFYANDASTNDGKASVGIAPELSLNAKIAKEFIKMSNKYANNMPVWITETGYDIGPKTPQRAIPIGNKNSQVTQADWNLRAAFLYARTGLKKCVFYMLDDVDLNSTTQYNSSGFVNSDRSKRPVSDYFLQTKKLIGNYNYTSTINGDPIVDLYKLDKKEVYVLTIPDQKGRTAKYELNLGNAKQAIIHTLQIGKNEMLSTTVNTTNGKLEVEVTETPIFVEKL
ncbi:MAG: beta-galactosidase [Pedobacter sp.]|uniref:beta-galactosidase n=1 Tax=Pedobacter sp. TaxID=1411316 RepID=UPI00356A2899